MRCYTFIAKAEDISGNTIKLKEDINHFKNVLRIKVDDTVRIVDGKKEYSSKVKEINKNEITLEILNSKLTEESELKLTAAIALIKSDNMSLIVKSLTEIGISNLIPIYTKRTVVKDFNLNKYEKISKEALKQCSGITFMNISSPKKLEEIQLENYDLKIMAYEKATSKLNTLTKSSKNIIFFIGPEGGFEEYEYKYLKENGCVSVTLGKRILRAETAAIVMGGYLINEF